MTGKEGIGDEGGFSLPELLVVIVILGIVSFVLTEAFILGLKTTDATARDLSRYVDIQTLQSFFTGDAQSADEVSTAPTSCASADPGVFLNMSRTDRGVATTVAYSLDPPAGTEQDLVRWSCTGASVERRLVGHFSRREVGPAPIVASCGDAAGGTVPCLGAPATVTLTVQPEAQRAASTMTIRRRAP